MNEVYIELQSARSETRTVEGVRKNGNTYIAYVREDFNPSQRGDLEDLAGELKRAGLTINVGERETENDLRRLKIGSRVPVRVF